MELDFYKNKFKEYDIEVIIPQSQITRAYIQQILKEELGVGLINQNTKKNYIKIAEELIENGAECIVLGCTELTLLLSQDDLPVHLFDTTKIHAQAIVDYITSEVIR